MSPSCLLVGCGFHARDSLNFCLCLCCNSSGLIYSFENELNIYVHGSVSLSVILPFLTGAIVTVTLPEDLSVRRSVGPLVRD